jgi:hypothetical protein
MRRQTFRQPFLSFHLQRYTNLTRKTHLIEIIFDLIENNGILVEIIHACAHSQRTKKPMKINSMALTTSYLTTN